MSKKDSNSYLPLCLEVFQNFSFFSRRKNSKSNFLIESPLKIYEKAKIKHLCIFFSDHACVFYRPYPKICIYDHFFYKDV